MTETERKTCPIHEAGAIAAASDEGVCYHGRCAWWCPDPLKPEDGRCAITAIASAIRGLGAR